MSEPEIKKPLLKRKKGKASSTTPKEWCFSDAFESAADKKFDKGHGAVKLSNFLQLPGLSLEGKFVLQYLFGADVIPFNREVNIQGPPGEGKSQFAWFLAKIFFDSDGFAGVVETESKTSPAQVRSILQRADADMDKCAMLFKAKTTEAMLAKMNFVLEFFRDNVPRRHPCLLIVDSFSHPTSEKIKEQVKKEGVASTGFGGAQNAAVITNTSKANDDILDTGPFVKILIHHEKVAISDDKKWGSGFGGPEMKTSGGIHKDFKSSITIQVTKGGREDSITGGSRTTHWLTGTKMAIGQDKRRVPIVVHDRMITPPIKDIPEGADPIEYRYQKIDIDWNTSLMLILKNIYEDKYGFKNISKAETKKITSIGISGKQAWGSAFGIKEADKIPFYDMGALLHMNKDMIRKLQKIMHIDHYKPWDQIVKEHDEGLPVVMLDAYEVAIPIAELIDIDAGTSVAKGIEHLVPGFMKKAEEMLLTDMERDLTEAEREELLTEEAWIKKLNKELKDLSKCDMYFNESTKAYHYTYRPPLPYDEPATKNKTERRTPKVKVE